MFMPGAAVRVSRYLRSLSLSVGSVASVGQIATAQDESAIMEAIHKIEQQAVREQCWNIPAGWHGVDLSVMPPASNILTRYDFNASLLPYMIQRSFSCANFDKEESIEIGEACIWQRSPNADYMQGKNTIFQSVRSTVRYEDGSSVESVDGVLFSEEGYHLYEVVLPDRTDAYLQADAEVALTIFNCSSNDDMDRQLFMTACQAVIELTTLDSNFKPGMALCESLEDIPERGP